MKTTWESAQAGDTIGRPKAQLADCRETFDATVARLVKQNGALLEALRHMVELVDACRADNVAISGDEWPIEQARAVIAQAEGRTA